MANHRANKYVRYNNQFYSIELGDIVFQRKQGATEWQPLVVHREFKHTIDRTKAKELRQHIKPFMEYFNVVCDIVEAKYDWGNAISRTIHNGEHGIVKPEQALELFKPVDDGVPDLWLTMAERYKHKIKSRWYWGKPKEETYDYERLSKEICNDLFPILKPCKSEEVPLGKLINDKYKYWYR